MAKRVHHLWPVAHLEPLAEPFDSHRDAAIALLSGPYRLTRKAGQFLGHIAVDPFSAYGLSSGVARQFTEARQAPSIEHWERLMNLAVTNRLDATFETSRFGEIGEVSQLGHKRDLPGNTPISKNGPRLAISNLLLGGAVLLSRTGERGGARNRADRESEALTLAQVRNLIAAMAHARAIGLPFTRMITIHWQSGWHPFGQNGLGDRQICRFA